MKKKGFTMIELLAVIVIISIILLIATYSCYSFMRTSEKKLKKLEVDNLINAGIIYQKEFENSTDYVSYVDENKITYSCISIQSLINKGIYKNDLEFYNEDLSTDKTVIKVKKENGVSSYELISNYVEDKDCSYYDYDNKLNDDTELILKNNDDDDSNVSLTTTILDNFNDKNKYTLRLKFTADMQKEIVNHTVPVYILIVLDSSGSMVLKNRYKPAVNSAIDLSREVINNVDNSYVALLNFDYKSYVKRNFQSKELSSSDFRESVSGQLTNVLSALDTAYNMMSKVDKNSIKYVVFLTDGVPAVPDYSSKYYDSFNQYKEYSKCGNNKISSECEKALIQYSNRIKDNNTNFVVIGYDINHDVYKRISSVDTNGISCPNSEYKDSNGNSYCYYYSNSSNISSLFSSISNSIQETVKAQKVSESIVNAKFDKSIKIYDMSGNEVDNLVINIKLDDNSVDDVFVREYEYIINIENLDEDNLNCDYEKRVCTYSSNLFKDYYVDLYDKNNKFLGRLKLDSSPIVTINRDLKSFLN